MKIHSPAPIPADRGGRAHWLAGMLAFAAAMFAANAPAQAPAGPGNAPPPLAADKLEKLVGRIALYPDDLIAIILPASTNPLQIDSAACSSCRTATTPPPAPAYASSPRPRRQDRSERGLQRPVAPLRLAQGVVLHLALGGNFAI